MRELPTPKSREKEPSQLDIQSLQFYCVCNHFRQTGA